MKAEKHIRLAGFLCLVLAAGCGGGPVGEANVLLITVDTIRPDAFGWVAEGNATPFVDRLSETGFAFPAAVTVAPITLPAHVSIHTGRFPIRHGVRDNGQFFASEIPTLAEQLGAAGYGTAAFVGGYPLDSVFGLDRGFDHYDDLFNAGTQGELERPAADTTRAALEWIRGAETPWFVWVHYYDPHGPYAAPPPFDANTEHEAYLGEVRYVDNQVGELLEGIPAAGAPPLTVLIGDHGEALGGHGDPSHGVFVYDDTVLVPLIFHHPGSIDPGRSDRAVRVVDVAPSILALLGLPPLAGADGIDLGATLAGAEQTIPPTYLESEYPRNAFGWSPLYGMRTDAWKYIRAPREEFYDLQNDPGESRNVIASYSIEADRLRDAMEELEEGTDVVASREAIDRETREKLLSLGYVGTLPAGSGAGDLPDAKDKVAILPTILEIEDRLRLRAYDEVLSGLDTILATDPASTYAVARKGGTLLAMGRAADAVPFLEQAVLNNVQSAENHFALADALSRAGEFERAVPEWREVVRLSPRRLEAWSNLGTILVQRGEPEEGFAALRQAAALAPTDLTVRENLAFALLRAGRKEQGVEVLLEIAAMTSEFLHPGLLGLALIEVDRPDEAEAWLRRARVEEKSYPRARVELARQLKREGRDDEARETLAELLRRTPELGRFVEQNAELQSILER